MRTEHLRRLRDSEGFTLIELLIVVVIIGILAAIAIPQFASTKEQAYVAQMKSDLRNSVTTMETEYAANGYTYTPTTDGALTESEGVALTIATKNADGYCIEATHQALDAGSTDPQGTWHIATGSGVPAADGDKEGIPVGGSC